MYHDASNFYDGICRRGVQINLMVKVPLLKYFTFDVYINIYLDLVRKSFNKAFLRDASVSQQHARLKVFTFFPPPYLGPVTRVICYLIGPDRSRDLNTGLWLVLLLFISASLLRSLSPMITLTTGCQTGRSRSQSQSSATLPTLFCSSLIKLQRADTLLRVLIMECEWMVNEHLTSVAVSDLKSCFNTNARILRFDFKVLIWYK